MVNCCYPLKTELKSHKINIFVQIKGIEGYPFITRFKTSGSKLCSTPYFGIEGYPFITRFKTAEDRRIQEKVFGIEGYPFITRFKTS